MRCLLCGMNARDVENIKSGLSLPFVITTTTVPLDGAIANVLPEHKLLVHIISTMSYLSVALKHNDLCGGGLVLAYDMPLIAPNSSEQGYLPDMMKGYEMNDSMLSLCHAIAFGVYLHASFDYVFRLAGKVPDSVLVDNGVLDGSLNGVVDVTSWQDVLSVLRIKGL